METKNIPLALIRSPSPLLSSPTRESLRRYGFSDVRTFDWAKLQSPLPCRIDRVFILPLHGDDLREQRLKTILATIERNPILGVIADKYRPNREVLAHVREFLYWPCSREEFTLRVERLSSAIFNSMSPNGQEELFKEFGSLEFIGASPAFIRVLKQLKKISACDVPVLIQGETGTGKEMAARSIHYLSRRKSYPFIPVNCGAIPDTLLENEFFGHEKGAFTDAKTSQMGVIRQADRGTLFLDEIEAFSEKGQVVLLRFLQDQVFKPLGSQKSAKTDVRIIAASNASLADLAKAERFRQDLLYRLNIMAVEMPPLSKRYGDVELLVEHFLRKLRKLYDQPHKTLHPEAMEWLIRYRWPGNVRELENMIHRQFLMSEGRNIRLGAERRTNADRRRNLWIDGRTCTWIVPFRRPRKRSSRSLKKSISKS